jgi:hypothetical protein
MDFMDFQSAQYYIQKLNSERFKGYNNWRLPTLEEAMSLVEPEEIKRKGKGFFAPKLKLHIHHLFGDQYEFWTGDKKDNSMPWRVEFFYGSCIYTSISSSAHVCAVRSD